MLTVRILSCGRARTGERDVKLATTGRQTLLTDPWLINIADTILQILERLATDTDYHLSCISQVEVAVMIWSLCDSTRLSRFLCPLT